MGTPSKKYDPYMKVKTPDHALTHTISGGGYNANRGSQPHHRQASPSTHHHQTTHLVGGIPIPQFPQQAPPLPPPPPPTPSFVPGIASPYCAGNPPLPQPLPPPGPFVSPPECVDEYFDCKYTSEKGCCNTPRDYYHPGAPQPDISVPYAYGTMGGRVRYNPLPFGSSTEPTYREQDENYYRGFSTYYEDYNLLNNMAKMRNDGSMYPVRQPPRYAPPEKQPMLQKWIDYVNHGGEWIGRQTLYIDDPEDPSKYRDPVVWTADQNPIICDRLINYGQAPDPTKFYHSRQALINMQNEDMKDVRDPYMRRVSATNLPEPKPEPAGLPPKHIAAETLDSYFESYID